MKRKGFKVFKSKTKTDQGTIWKYYVGPYVKIIKVDGSTFGDLANEEQTYRRVLNLSL